MSDSIDELPPEEHKRINLLSEQARVAKDRYARESAKLKADMAHMRGLLVNLKREATDARKAHVEAYTALGISRQR